MRTIAGFTGSTVQRRAPVVSAVEALNVETDRATTVLADLPEGSTVAEELARCAGSFIYFLRYWRFIDRETGVIRSFANPWPGQVEAAEAMEVDPRLFLLKAGKLGFTELECAFDGWVLLFRQPNAAVHVFSMDGPEAKILVKLVRFGLDHLPEWMQLPLAESAGSDTEKQLRWVAGRDDYRTLRAFASTPNASIADSCSHAHIDELARMPWPEATYSAALSTVPAWGSLHIVSRGAGGGSYSEKLWDQAQSPSSPLRPIFIPFWGRPRTPVRLPSYDTTQEQRNELWYEEQRGDFTSLQQLYMFAPRTAEEALAADAEEAFVKMELWDACFTLGLPELNPGDPDPCVLALDAGVSNDYFGAALVSRDPRKLSRAALRRSRHWKPQDGPGGVVDFDKVEEWVRLVCLGGCVLGHPNKSREEFSAYVDEETDEPCEACVAGNRMPAYNVMMITFDPHQLAQMSQRLARDGVAWVKAFDQNKLRLEADAGLRQLIMIRDFAHSERPSDKTEMRQHIMNAKIKVPKGEDSKARMEKRNAGSKIDLAVALSMGVKMVLWLQIDG